MAKKKVYRFSTIARAEKKSRECRNIRSQSLPWQRYSHGAQVAPQRCPILRSSAAILPRWHIFTSALIKMGSFSKLKWARFEC